jgi:hypothetical protein
MVDEKLSSFITELLVIAMTTIKSNKVIPVTAPFTRRVNTRPDRTLAAAAERIVIFTPKSGMSTKPVEKEPKTAPNKSIE